MLNLYPGEEVILTMSDVTLTNYRVRCERPVMTSILLPHVCSITKTTRRYPILLYLAALAVAVAIYLATVAAQEGASRDGRSAGQMALVVALGLIVAYLISHSTVLQIRSCNSAAVDLALNRDAEKLIEALEQAKLVLIKRGWPADAPTAEHTQCSAVNAPL